MAAALTWESYESIHRIHQANYFAILIFLVQKMNKNLIFNHLFKYLLLLIFTSLPPLSALAQITISEGFNGASTQNNWTVLGRACLTAGTETGSPFKRCDSDNAEPGYGVLRLTNNAYNEHGAIISTQPFPSDSGVQLTFVSNTYGGNNYMQTGADGLSFFLVDAAIVTKDRPLTLGGYGGSLGYACGYNTGFGMSGGYIGLGIDEYGNFSGGTKNSVRLRGAGNITSAALPGINLRDACEKGYYVSRSEPGKIIPVLNYAPIKTVTMPAPISNGGPITFSLSITKAGLLSLSYIFNNGISTPVITSQSIITSNGNLPDNFLFGFAASTGHGTNFHEISCFKASQITTSSSSAGSNVNPNARVQQGSQIYLASYNLTNATGRLTASSLLTNPDGSISSISPLANWDASCVLTGGICSTTNSTTIAQTSRQRNILTWNETGGIPFRWQKLNEEQKKALTAGDTTRSAQRLRFLRGGRNNERTSSGNGIFRARSSVLADIIKSSPTWVGPPQAPYAKEWQDALYNDASMPESGAASYAWFQTSNATRMHVVYVGANDGMLHGFRAGSFDESGKFTSNIHPNDGKEVIAYVPGLALQTLHSSDTPSLDYASPQYAHNAFVDATPGTGDLFYQGAWHTWLVGGLGAGGNKNGVLGRPKSNHDDSATGGLYALDISHPSSDIFTEKKADTLVIGDWNSDTLSCINSTACGKNLGSVYGTPVIRRLHDGNWAAIFGNGLDSNSGSAGIFIMTVNSASGKISFRYLDTGHDAKKDPTGSNTKNGISFVTPADLDKDHITDYVYAGDVLGNIWRFDLTSNNANLWTAEADPLFSASTTSTLKPVSTAVTVSAINNIGNLPYLLINFATGRQFPQTLSNAAVYAQGTQSLYGIWDWNMKKWNKLNSTRYSSLASVYRTKKTITSHQLATQTFSETNYINNSSQTQPAYLLTDNTICWSGSLNCSTELNSHYGWQIDLPNNTEQVIYSPTTLGDIFFVNTTMPAVPPTAATGNSYAVNIATGSTGHAFRTVTGNADIAGIGLNATGTSYFVTGSNGATSMINQTTGSDSLNTGNTGNNGVITHIDIPKSAQTGSRMTWLQLR